MLFATATETPGRAVRRVAVVGAAVLSLSLSLAGCAPQPPAESSSPAPSESSASPTPSAPAYVQPETCAAMLGPIEAEFLAEGAELMSGPLEAEAVDPAGVTQRILDLGGIYCSYAEMYVDGSGRGLAAAPLGSDSRVEVEAYLLSQGLERIEFGDTVVLRGAGTPEEFPSPARLHVLRADSWIYTTNNWGGLEPAPYDDVEAWAQQMAELAYPE